MCKVVRVIFQNTNVLDDNFQRPIYSPFLEIRSASYCCSLYRLYTLDMTVPDSIMYTLEYGRMLYTRKGEGPFSQIDKNRDEYHRKRVTACTLVGFPSFYK
jgi:hypothetical protein